MLHSATVILQCRWHNRCCKPWSKYCHSNFFITYLWPLYLTFGCCPYTEDITNDLIMLLTVTTC